MKENYYYNEHDENQVTKLFKKKKKKKIKRKIKILCFLLLLILIVYYFLSDFSKVKSIEIIGNDDVSSSLIEETSTLNNETIYLFINKKKVENHIKNLPLIKKANVSYDLFGHVTIEIEESKKVAYCTIQKTTYVLDELGKVVETEDENIKETLKSCPKLNGFLDLDFLKTFAKEYANVPELIKTQTSDIIYSPANADQSRIEFILDNGKKLIVRVDNMAKELSNFPYEAYMTIYENKCEFDFYGDNVYIRECEEHKEDKNDN